MKMELTNKKIVFLGDSITEGHGTTNPNKVFHQIIKQEYNLELAINCGIGGTRIAKNKKPTLDFTKHDLYFGLRAETMPTDIDVVVVFGGTNDYGHGDALLGNKNSNDDYTFNGALNNLILKLKMKYPNKKIIFLTPLHRVLESEHKNINGYILKDYVDAIIERTKYHNIKLIDLFNELSLDPYDKNLVPDGLHPNDDGHKIIADFLTKKLLKI